MKNFRIVVLILAFALLAGCGRVERSVASWTGYSRICVDGVQYIQFTSGATVAYNRDGTIKTCN